MSAGGILCPQIIRGQTAQQNAVKALVVSLKPATSSFTPITSGLTNWWKFTADSGTSVTDTIGGNTGTLTTGTAWTSGPPGSPVSAFAISLNGTSQYMSFSQTSSMSVMSVSTWINPTAVTGGVYQAIIADIFNSSDKFAQFDIKGANPNLYYLGDNLSSGTVSAGAWSNIILTLSGSTGIYYINGTSAGSFSFNASITFGAIGIATSSSNLFGGLIGETRIYNRVLSSTEAAAIASFNG